MRSYRDDGLVLRHYNLGEADRIIVLFTRRHGLVRAVAKGVRRQRSRFGARLEPFTISDIELYPGRNLATITDVHTIETFNENIVSNYERYTAAMALLEATERLVGEEGVSQPALFDLTVGAIGALAAGQRQPRQMLDTFLLRAMGEAGWAPELSKCAVCGAAGPHHFFHPAAGGMVCSQHRPPGSAGMMGGVSEYLQALRDANWATADALGQNQKIGKRLQKEAHRLIVAHLQWHTERKITALSFVDEAERSR